MSFSSELSCPVCNFNCNIWSLIYISGNFSGKSCRSVNYVSWRICAVEGSSVNISSDYTFRKDWSPKYKIWYKVKRSGKGDAVELTEVAGRLEYHDNNNTNGRHILRIKKLRKNDSAEYIFRSYMYSKSLQWRESDSPGVILVVTGKIKYLNIFNNLSLTPRRKSWTIKAGSDLRWQLLQQLAKLILKSILQPWLVLF